MGTGSPGTRLRQLGETYYRLQHTTDPFNATRLGVPGFDALVPDPSLPAAARLAENFRTLQEAAQALIHDTSLNRAGQLDAMVLHRLAEAAGSALTHPLWDANVSAQAYASPQAAMLHAVPAAIPRTSADMDDYMARLGHLPGYLRGVLDRYRTATKAGRCSTQVGVYQAIRHLDGHLATPPEGSSLLCRPAATLPHREERLTAAADTIRQRVLPALQELRDGLRREVLPTARGNEQVGISAVPGGTEGYHAALRRYTTTRLSPEQIHEIGLARLNQLRGEWARTGSRALGTSDPADIAARLRGDPSLRAHSRNELVDIARAALHRASSARNAFLPTRGLPGCTIEEIADIDAEADAAGYYRPAAVDGSRPGAYFLATSDPAQRFTFEYEALTFHESIPGHHLQISTAQALNTLPRYRRSLDTEASAFVEGWGLYSEALADEMGLYSTDLSRLGMLSFDALRACRLVVDTGIHSFNWSRKRAIDFLWHHTATPRANCVNEVDRYIGWPGQATAYLIGSQTIMRLRRQAQHDLGRRFDIGSFHQAVLGNGAIPLDALTQAIHVWVQQQASHQPNQTP